MKKLVPFSLSLLILFPFMNSCMMTFGNFPGYSSPLHTVDFYESLALSLGGTLSLEGIDGNIDISGWDREKVEVYAERRIPLYAGRGVMWQPIGRYLPKIDIDQFEDFVKINTRPPKREENASTVDYFINVPRHIQLKDIIARRGDIFVSDLYGEVVIELEEGEIKVDNFSGSLHVSLGVGSVEASLMDLRSEDEIRISAEEGDIIVYLQEDVSAQMEASTLEGEVKNEFNPEEGPSANRISFHTGGEEAVISLSTSKGNISIKKYKEKNGKILEVVDSLS